MIIKLSVEEQKFCADLGKKRHLAKHESFRNRNRFDNFEVEYMPHFLGVLGEYVYAKYAGLKLDEEIYAVRDSGEDFAGIEIKMLTYFGAGEPELKVPQKEFEKRTEVQLYVLVRTRKDAFANIELLGQITRKEFDLNKVAKKYGRYNPLNWIVPLSKMEKL